MPNASCARQRPVAGLPGRFSIALTSSSNRQVPWATLLTITGALVYFLMPLDAIPDPIIGLGLLDDMGVLAKAWQFSRQDIERYQRWRDRQEDPE